VPSGGVERAPRGRPPARGAPPEKQSATPAAEPQHRKSATANVRQRHHHRRTNKPDNAASPSPSRSGAENKPQGSSATSASSLKSSGIRIAVGADHGGVALKDAVSKRLTELGHTVRDLGTSGTEAVDYPDFAIAVARAVASREANLGIMIDGAGIGSAMAANKVAGARAALCYDVTTATNAREHNNANVLTLGGGLIGTRLALNIVETFIATPFAGGRHQTRVGKIDALDEARGGR
jgi:ribose 5-phosphate isomerase B